MPVYRLPDTGTAFPDPMLAEPDGLLAVGGDLSPARIIAAYASGIFPWYSEESPILWWSPDPRCILLPDELHVPRSLRRMLNAGIFRFTMDTAFEAVITGCARTRGDGMGTWLVSDMIEAYTTLFHFGLAHSVEAWHEGELAGGLYGLALGSVFFRRIHVLHQTGRLKDGSCVFSANSARIRVLPDGLPAGNRASPTFRSSGSDSAGVS